MGMADQLPLSALLSQALIAFTIEFDNEFEHQTPHRTTTHTSAGAPGQVPWLVSMVMWTKFLRFVPDDGIAIGEFKRQAALTKKELKMWLPRLATWWGYITVDKTAAEDPSNWLIRPSRGGQKAFEVWKPLTGVIESRWEKRFGKNIIDELRRSLQSLVDQLNPEFPSCLPILGYELLTTGPDPELRARSKSDAVSAAGQTLPTLLSKVLLAFAIQFERESHLSLALGANVLRLLGEATRVRNLPRLSGVSKGAIDMAVKRLQAGGLTALVQEEEKHRPAKALRLTSKGQGALDTYYVLVSSIEKRWKTSFSQVVDLRKLLEHIAHNSSAAMPSLFDGLQPYPDGWRASVGKLEVLPHYPMILHRGGFPDGS